MRRGARAAALLLAWAAAAVPAAAGAQEAGASVIVRGARTSNLYLAGGAVDVHADLEKDLIAAGGTVMVGQMVGGDVIVAGGTVHIGGRVGDDVRAAGGTVTVAGAVEGDVLAAGGTVSLRPETVIGGRLWAGGGRVDVAGHVRGSVRVAAGMARLSGRIDGDVDVVAGTVEVLPSARIGGELRYRSPAEARIDEGAVIAGPVTAERLGVDRDTVRRWRTVWRGAQLGALLGLVVAGLVFVALFPGFAMASAGRIAREPWRSVGTGFALLVAIPAAAALVMLTLVGIPAALAALAVYPVALLVGHIVAGVFLGSLGTRLDRLGRAPSRRRRMLFATLGLIGLGLLALVPVLGAVVVFLAVVTGLGAWTREAHARYAGGRGDPS